MSQHHRLKTGERAMLDPLDALAGDAPARDQRNLIERPFFSLAKTKRVQPILYKSGDTECRSMHCLNTAWRPSGTPTY